MNTKIVVALALSLGLAQTAMASLDSSQQNNPGAVKTVNSANVCPYQAANRLMANTAFEKQNNNSTPVPGSAREERAFN